MLPSAWALPFLAAGLLLVEHRVWSLDVALMGQGSWNLHAAVADGTPGVEFG